MNFNKHSPVISLIIANFIWGAASPIFKWSLTNIEPFTLAFLRFFIATIIILPFALKNISIELKDLNKIFLMALFGTTINISLFFLGLEKTSSINAPIIASAGPIFLFIGGFFLLREKLKTKTILGGILGFFGVLTIIFIPIIERGVDGSFVGNLFLVGATLAGVVHVILNKELAKKYNSLTLVFWTFLIATITFFPLFFWETQSKGFLVNLDYKGIIGIIFGALLSSAVAYYLFYYAVEKMDVADVGIFTYMDPVVAILIAAPLLGEIPDALFVMGSFLVFFGIFISEGRIHYHLFQKRTKR